MSVMRRVGLVLLLGLLLCLSPQADSNAPIEQLSPDAEPLRGQFNRDVDGLRLLLLLDPT